MTSGTLLFSQLNNVGVLWEQYDQFKPVIIRALPMETISDVFINGYFVVMPSDVSRLKDFEKNPENVTIEFLELGKDGSGKDLRYIFYGGPGAKTFSFKYPMITQNDPPQKLTYVVQDAKQVDRMKLVVCGKLLVNNENFGGFVLYINIDRQGNGSVDDLRVYPELETLSSVVNVSGEKAWILCGTKKPGQQIKEGTKGVILRLNYEDPPNNCSGINMVWAYEFFSPNNTAGQTQYVTSTSFEKIKDLNLLKYNRYGIIGTTNECKIDADLFFVTIDETGQNIQQKYWGAPFDSQKKIAYKEYGKSFEPENIIIDDNLSSVFVIGRYLQQISPETSPTDQADDLLAARFKNSSGIGTYNFNILDWANRYELYRGRSYSDLPEDIMHPKKTPKILSVLGNLKIDATNYDGFIMELHNDGTAPNYTQFGDKGDDRLYSFTRTYDGNLGAVGISDSYSTGAPTSLTPTMKDLWVVNYNLNSLDKDSSIKGSPNVLQIPFNGKTINSRQTKFYEKCYTVSLLKELMAKDSLICESKTPDTCLCEDIHITTSKIDSVNCDTCCCYILSVDFSCQGDLTSIIDFIRFHNPGTMLQPFEMSPMAGNPFTVYSGGSGDWTFKAPDPITSGIYKFKVCFNPNYNIPNYEHDNCRLINVDFISSFHQQEDSVVCEKRVEICCPACPVINSIKIECDSIIRNLATAVAFPSYDICINYYYVGPSQILYIDYFGATSGNTHASVSMPGTYCFNIVDYYGMNPGQTIYFVTYFLDASGEKYCIDTTKAVIPDCCPDYSQMSVVCGNMTYLGQTYNISMTATNNWLNNSTVHFGVNSGTVSPTIKNLNPGSNPVSLTYTNTSSLPAGSTVWFYAYVIMGQDTSCYYSSSFVLPQCDTTHPCVIETYNRDSSCCCYTISIINPPTKDIASVSLTTWGGVVKSWDDGNSCGIGMTQSLPSNSLNWNFTPPCTANIQWDVCFEATTASGWVYSQWTVNYTDGTNCKHLDSIKCIGAANQTCDSVTKVYWPDITKQLAYTRITINNLKVPVSPICSVMVSYDPPTMPGSGNNAPSSGSELRLNSGTPISNRWIAPFNQILLVGPTPTINCNYGDNISFNVAFGFNENWSGNIKLKIIHCDGTICFTDVPASSLWSGITTGKYTCIADTPYVVDPGIYLIGKMKIRCIVFKEEGDRVALTMKDDGLSLIDKSDENPQLADMGKLKFVAISSSPLFNGTTPSNNINASLMGDNVAYFEIDKPEGDNDSVEISYLIKGKIPKKFTMLWTVYDDKGNVVDGDSISMLPTGIVQTTNPNNPEMHIQVTRVYPLPSEYKLNIDYYLTESDIVLAELLDMNGKVLTQFDGHLGLYGPNTLTIMTPSIPNGDYLVRFRTSKGHEAVTKIVIMK